MPSSERSTTTEATDATTVEPMSDAFMSPMISSSVKITAATGVLNAADSAPAVPTAIRSLTRFGESFSRWPITDAMPPPICTDGPSRPMEWPDAMHSTPVMNFPMGTRAGITPPCR